MNKIKPKPPLASSSSIIIGSKRRESGTTTPDATPPSVESSKAAKLLGLSASTPKLPQRQKSILTYDQWVQDCYTPWLQKETSPESGQTLLTFFRKGAGIQVREDYEEWLQQEGEHLIEVVNSNNWRKSFHRFLTTKTSEAGQSLIEELDDSVVILPRQPRSSSMEQLPDATQTKTVPAPQPKNFTLQALKRVLLNEVSLGNLKAENVAVILGNFAQELTGNEESESGDSLTKELTKSAAEVGRLRALQEDSVDETTQTDLSRRLSFQAKPSRTSVGDVEMEGVEYDE